MDIFHSFGSIIVGRSILTVGSQLASQLWKASASKLIPQYDSTSSLLGGFLTFIDSVFICL